MTQQLLQHTGVHCKVTCDDQIRRFLFTDGTEFDSLKNQVRTTLELQEEFVLKYKDDEGDHVTISSKEELEDALKYSNGLLRLIALITKKAETEPTKTNVIDAGISCGGRGRRGHHAHHPHEHHGGRGRHGRGGHYHDHGCQPNSEAWTAKLTLKRDLLKQHLDSLGSVETTEQQKLKRAKLEAKLAKVEESLQKITSNDLNEREDKDRMEKKQKKLEKKQKKWEKKEKKMIAQSKGTDLDELEVAEGKRKAPLSPETKAKIESLKKEIQELKPALKGAKQELRAKKIALRMASRSGEETKVWEDEVQLWKEIKNEHKNQILPLKEQIRSLKQQNLI